MAPRVWRRRTLERCLAEVGKATGRPECFLTRIQDGLASKFTSLTKVLYDFNKILENGRIHGSPLQKLVIENFDDEQIWQQLELQNEPILQYFQNAVGETINDEDISLLPESEEQECEEDGSEIEADDQEDLEDLEEEEEVSDMGDDDPEVGERTKNSSKSGLRKSPVFSDEDSDLDFDISKLEQQNIDSDEDEGGLFGSKKLKSGKSSRNLKYKDFFDPVESDEDITSVHDDELNSNKEDDEIAEEEAEELSISET
ncbi:hypothetical protein H8958_012747 [Nasalis larvatus]